MIEFNFETIFHHSSFNGEVSELKEPSDLVMFTVEQILFFLFFWIYVIFHLNLLDKKKVAAGNCEM